MLSPVKPPRPGSSMRLGWYVRNGSRADRRLLVESGRSERKGGSVGGRLMKQPDGLIEVLLDNSESISERDDAAMDLAEFDEDEAIDALLAVATNGDDDTIVQDSAGTSLGEIWKRRGIKTPPELDGLSDAAQIAAKSALNAPSQTQDPRRLTTEQRTAICKDLRDSSAVVVQATDVSVGDPRGFANDLIHAIQDAGWRIENRFFGDAESRPSSGLVVEVVDPDARTNAEAALVGSLKRLGVKFDVERGVWLKPGQLGVRITMPTF